MPTWTELWKKAKPVTLLSEPLTAAMKQLDVDDKAFVATHSREALAKLSGSTKTARRAVDETIKKCNPTLHKEGIKQLGILGATLDSSIGLIQKWQLEVVKQTEDVNKRKAPIVQYLSTVGTRPNGQVAQKGTDAAKQFSTWLSGLNVYKSDEVVLTMKYAALAESLLTSMAKELGKADGARKPAVVQGLQKEAADLAKKLATPLKFASPGKLPGMGDRPFTPGRASA